MKLGLYDPGCPPHLASPPTPETHLGAPVRVVSWYQAWGSCFRDCHPDLILEAHRRGLLPLITWEPWKLPEDLAPGSAPEAQPDFSLARIASGFYEEYVRSWARALAATGKTVFLRPMHEMNGNWYPWGGAVNGNNAYAFRQAWVYLRRIYREEGGSNVVWVWCPYVQSVPEIPGNALEAYFPGESEVDWLALDGYNWGTSQPWSRWQTFSEIFGETYTHLHTLAPDKPMMLAEVGCTEQGGDKAAWISDALTACSENLTSVQILVWFNVNKECDWRLDSSPECLAAFREQSWRFRPK